MKRFIRKLLGVDRELERERTRTLRSFRTLVKDRVLQQVTAVISEQTGKNGVVYLSGQQQDDLVDRIEAAIEAVHEEEYRRRCRR